MEHGSAELVRTEVLEKAVRILELLADHPRGLSLARVSDLAVLPKTSAHRLLLSWLGLGYVLRLANGDFALGLQAVELARRVARRSRPVEICHGLLRQWQQKSGESVYFGVYRNGAVILVDAAESAHPVRVVVDLGEQCHLHASAQGLSVAVFLDPDWLKKRLLQSGLKSFTSRTNTDWNVLFQRFAEARKQGYAVNTGETIEGAYCIGAPVFAGPDGPVLGSIGVSLPEFRATKAECERQRELLIDMANQMTTALSGLETEPEARGRNEYDCHPAEGIDRHTHLN